MNGPGRVVVAVVLAVTALALWRRTRPAAPPGDPRPGVRSRIVQCPIHGVAYDAELEICPACATAPT
jgi:hypothetical protein